MKRSGFLVGLSSVAVGMTATATRAANTAPRNRIVGVVVSVSGNTLILRKRNGQNVVVDLSEAAANRHVGVIAPGVVIEVHGTRLADGTFHCISTSHSSDVVQSWEPDN